MTGADTTRPTYEGTAKLGVAFSYQLLFLQESPLTGRSEG